MATVIFYVELKCRQQITKDYPLMKFFSLMDNLIVHYEKINKETKR